MFFKNKIIIQLNSVQLCLLTCHVNSQMANDRNGTHTNVNNEGQGTGYMKSTQETENLIP